MRRPRRAFSFELRRRVEQEPEVVVDLPHGGIEPQRLLEGLHRLLVLAHLRQDQPQVVVRLGVVGMDLDGPLERLQGRLQGPAVVQRHAAVVALQRLVPLPAGEIRLVPLQLRLDGLDHRAVAFVESAQGGVRLLALSLDQRQELR